MKHPQSQYKFITTERHLPRRKVATYKHYSFDLWLTLIKSNPHFKKERAKIFHERFNTLGKPLEEVQHIFRRVDLMVNSINEATGKNIDADEMYLMVISMINDGEIDLHEIDIDALYTNMEHLVLQHMPIIYCDSTADTLAYLKDCECTLNLLSNTGFIKGTTLRKVLAYLAIDKHFDFMLFSDEAGLSKPNPAFFKLMLSEVSKLRAIEPQDIIHIGDNPHADIWGADMVGVNSLLVNSNNISITALKELYAV